MTIETINPKTWCPGCFNFQILSGLKNAMSKQLETKKKEDFAIVTGIGCHDSSVGLRLRRLKQGGLPDKLRNRKLPDKWRNRKLPDRFRNLSDKLPR